LPLAGRGRQRRRLLLRSGCCCCVQAAAAALTSRAGAVHRDAQGCARLAEMRAPTGRLSRVGIDHGDPITLPFFDDPPNSHTHLRCSPLTVKQLSVEQLIAKKRKENVLAARKAERKRQREARLKERVERAREKIRQKADKKRQREENAATVAAQSAERRRQRADEMAVRANAKIAEGAKRMEDQRERQSEILNAAVEACRPAAAQVAPQAPGELKLKLFVPSLKLKLKVPLKPPPAKLAQLPAPPRTSWWERKAARQAGESSSAPGRGVVKASSKAKLVRVKLGGAVTLMLFG